MSNKELQYHHAIAAKPISSNEVHVWRLFVDEASAYSKSLQKILSAEELERAAKFHFEKDKERFITARGVLRKILGNYLAIKSQEINFEYASFGKPIISDNQNRSNINFNLSHSDTLVLYAITRNRKIGIDVERIRNAIDVLQVAKKFFSSNEIAALESTAKENQHKIFFQFWARKEALVKGIGEGLSYPLEQIDVSSINEKSLKPVILSGNYKERSEWYVQDLFQENGYVAAIAVADNDCKISCLYDTHKILSL